MSTSTTERKWQMAEQLTEQVEREGVVPENVVAELAKAVDSQEPSRLVALVASFWRGAHGTQSTASALRAAGFTAPPAPAVPPAITGPYPDGSLWVDADWPDKLVQQGALLNATVFRDVMGWSRQALSKALNEHRVFYVSRGSKRLYPSFFASTAYDSTHVQSVSRTLGALPGESKMLFFTAPKLSLGQRSPLEVLAKGQIEPVLAAAHAFAER